MEEKVITDNVAEKIIVRWDTERFFITGINNWSTGSGRHTIVLNPREMADIIDFVNKIVLTISVRDKDDRAS